MALSANTRNLVSRVRTCRADCVLGYSRGESHLTEIVRRARGSVELQDLYLVKVLEAHPRLGKVCARRTMSQLNIGTDASLGSLGDDVVVAIETAIASLVSSEIS